MSNYRSGNKHLHHDIRNYRDMAPESLSDDALLELVRQNGKNDVAIREALSTLWNEEPATEWISTEKKKLKKPTSPPLPERGGGGRGRGRSAPPGRGEGGRGGRGPGGRSSSVNTSGGRGRGGAPKVDSPSPNLESNPEEVEPTTETTAASTTTATVAVVAATAPAVAITAHAEAPVAQPSKPSAVPVAPVWGRGTTLAQKLREQEIAANAPPPPPTPPQQPEPEPPVEVPAVVVAAPSTTTSASAVAAAAAADVSSIAEEEVNTTPEPVSSEFAGQSKRSPRGADAGRGRGRRRAYRDHPHARVDPENQNKEASQESEVSEEPTEEFNKALEQVSLEKESSHSHTNAILSPEVDISHHTPAISDMVIISPVRPANAPVSDNIVGSPVLKMGRWGAPIEATEASSFQFGSFGNLGEASSAADHDGDESPHKIASGLISSLSEPQSTWGQQQQLDQNSLSQSDRDSEAVSASLSVWGNSQSQNDNSDDHYGYDQQVSNSGNDNAPPGLGLGLGGLDTSAVVSQSNSNKSNTNNRNNRSAPGSQTRKSDVDNNMSRQPQQYYQPVPPGIQGGFGLPYYGFDMSVQPPATAYGGAPQGSTSPSPAASGPSTQSNASTNANNQNGANYNANGNNAPKYPGPPGMPAQMGNPYPPYYGNPYYQQAFYYGGAQPQNFYDRGGQGVYPPRPYGGNPYAPQGMGGYDMYGQPSQFGEGVYGQMPMPPMHPQQGTNDRQSGKGNKNSGQNSQQSAGVVGSAAGASNVVQANQGDANQAVHGYGMGGYNYGRPDQGSGWAPYQPGWGGMMPFPVAPGGGYSQMSGAPSQPANNRQGGGSYSSYGRGNGGSSSTGSGDPAGGIGSAGAGTTSSW